MLTVMSHNEWKTLSEEIHKGKEIRVPCGTKSTTAQRIVFNQRVRVLGWKSLRSSETMLQEDLAVVTSTSGQLSRRGVPSLRKGVVYQRSHCQASARALPPGTPTAEAEVLPSHSCDTESTASPQYPRGLCKVYHTHGRTPDQLEVEGQRSYVTKVGYPSIQSVSNMVNHTSHVNKEAVKSLQVRYTISELGVKPGPKRVSCHEIFSRPTTKEIK
ncbi:hypothetical protein PR048_011203 [Dryococelus australis]|uniref:Uncharacterized protein n=1 Tax=Dryococelus australis TaxID=614101 RepID=A0ABQ9HL84_9NEOP|nr:hypothetical protein PR048_011203 [Dryococelus australis]